MAERVCIVSPGSLASNPRVLKEAGALHEAGYDVTTVVCDYAESLRDADNQLMRSVPWKVVRVPRSRAGRAAARAARAVAGAADRIGATLSPAINAAAYGGPSVELSTAAGSVPADLYIAHYVAALPGAAAAT
jgi:hypothetical protein